MSSSANSFEHHKYIDNVLKEELETTVDTAQKRQKKVILATMLYDFNTSN